MRPMNFSIDGEAVECVKSFLYLGILTHESGYSTPETSKRLGLAGSAFGSLRTNICDSRFALSIKVRLFRTYVFPVLLYGAELWSITKKDQLWLDAFGTKCLRLICTIRWFDFSNNYEV